MAAMQDLQNPMKGIIYRLMAIFFLASMFVLVKLASQHDVHVVESLFYRFLVALVIVLPWIAMQPGPFADRFKLIATKRPGAHLARAMIGLCAMTLNYLGYILLPLAEATTIGFAVPIFATLLSVVVLAEMVGIHRWGAIIFGFVGILIVVQPGDGHLPLTGALVALGGALMTAGVSVLIRSLGTTESTLTTVFWFTALALPPLAVAMLFFGQSHDVHVWAMLLGIGLTGGAGQFALTASLRYAPVSVVMPMDYTSLIWATIFGWLIYDTLPIAATWMGAPIIIASGLYIVWREQRLKKRAQNVAKGVVN